MTLHVKHGILTGFWFLASMILLVFFGQQLVQITAPGFNLDRLLLTLATLGVSELCFYYQCNRWQEAIDAAKKKAEAEKWLGNDKTMR